ncbi:Inner nuclear membrane protein [Lachnellula subtilissima]|uniref:Inner nuclear membrane protein n=1 Tax=Lachnellula subtilissima TaxID=602034 RepID=A0A8H8RNR5_9HELO|nr:Inner nuclear membrane protein [Lachnellula subtilissima]
MSDTESLDYLQTGFEPASLTVPRLRSILVSYGIEYPSSAKKAQLVQIFTDKVLPQGRKILAARARARRTSKGITNADRDETDEEMSMPPPPTPRTRTRKPSAKVRAEESESDMPVLRSPTKRTPRASSKHARVSDTETDPGGIKKSIRRSLIGEPPTPAPATKVKVEDDNFPVANRRESAFTYDNPFQSGSSPLSESRNVSGERKRKSLGVSSSNRKSSSTSRRKTSVEPKIEDGFHPPTSATFEIPVSELNGLKDVDENGVEASEEFTPEEQLELVRERSVNGIDALGPRRPKKQEDRKFNKKGPIWVALLTLLGGYATWYRQEKVAVGYCGVGRNAYEVIPKNMDVPDWVRVMAEPECEACPQHAYCRSNLDTECEADFVLKPHPLSLGGLVPLPPTCEPDGEKVRRVKAVADKAINELRDRRAKWECGDLTDEAGSPEPTVEIDAEELKKEVSKKRRKGMGEEEFEELWAGAIGEIKGREEVVSGADGNRNLLSSTSLARLPFTCALKRSFRLTLARHRLKIATLAILALVIFYIRHLFTSRAADNAAVPHLVSLTLDRLATQATLHVQDKEDYPEGWISIGQLRDDVLRDQHSLRKREALWSKVKKVVEMNANVRASQRESRSGEISRVWEWIGAVGEIDGLEKRRKSGRVSWGAFGDRSSPVSGSDGGPEIVQAKWQEGRPIY